jgi:hypothetical protein
MGIKCTCEGDIHRFTMYLKRIRKRNTVEQHQVMFIRSQIVGGNCLPIFGAFSILLHVHCAPFLSFSTIYVLLQFLTLLASMRIS